MFIKNLLLVMLAVGALRAIGVTKGYGDHLDHPSAAFTGAEQQQQQIMSRLRDVRAYPDGVDYAKTFQQIQQSQMLQQ